MADPDLVHALHDKADRILEQQQRILDRQARLDAIENAVPVTLMAPVFDTTCAVCGERSIGERVCGRADCPARPECFRGR